jgi:hypothetical protein
MIDLSFVQDSKLRASLQSDFEELEVAFSGGAWKSVHVLTGSIIEALLIETIFSVDKSASHDKYLKMSLNDIISDAVSRGIISDREEQLASVIKGYRNLIHPGRVIRMSESVDQNTASVAMSLIKIIVGKIEREQSDRIGLTANQVLSKIDGDASAFGISEHLTHRLSESELLVLMNDQLPAAVGRFIRGEQRIDCSTYCSVYRIAGSRLNQEQVRILEGHLIKIVESGTDLLPAIYFDILFDLESIKKFTQAGQDIILTYSIERFRHSKRDGFERFAGFSGLSDVYIEKFIDIIYDSVAMKYDQKQIDNLSNFLNIEEFRKDYRVGVVHKYAEAAYQRWNKYFETTLITNLEWQEPKEKLELFHLGTTPLPF